MLPARARHGSRHRGVGTDGRNTRALQVRLDWFCWEQRRRSCAGGPFPSTPPAGLLRQPGGQGSQRRTLSISPSPPGRFCVQHTAVRSVQFKALSMPSAGYSVPRIMRSHHVTILAAPCLLRAEAQQPALSRQFEPRQCASPEAVMETYLKVVHNATIKVGGLNLTPQPLL